MKISKVVFVIVFMMTSSLIRAQRKLESCGVSRVKSNASIDSIGDFSRGTWPWIVAILEKMQSSDDYFCTGTFILENKVLTGESF